MKEFAVIFDMDGVLVDSNPMHKKSIQKFTEKYGLELSEQELREKVYGRNNREWIPYLFHDEAMSPEQVKRYADEKESMFRDMYRDTIELLPGLRGFLNALQATQIPYAIATSAPRANVDFTLDETGTTRYFTTILHEAHFDKGKPDPEIYLKAAAALRFEPARCIVFEDSLAGVESGHRAGCHVIGITTTQTSEELLAKGAVATYADFRDVTLTDLEKYI
ncbi:haloacid dehalogenase superfamily, subfamily IA, variant 3 with third motif having DD or ED/beta-phosphoglucomutase family hydrolase [Catalinimonas alkaloidigena]|uniref:Haloacid dehalogenase superfamily, subfamily IA, variant 3 with third motif having DD or ED/beta-phosphoglucomutase family hydrolase n=1 Tax=Catalinimonas alkaloidigena TaxID=1075417 RepID=A0A1G9T679_9BACT|nr:HAD family phosphatase [Catalinimonas alkaloidigena]SDM43148.1 haloacid dehalogenase superfamily, subfamily IA, variant 3 with third motif having DD or ED/beta-phosphoglucomutase family hydrolase [Catalinimonas alkaloidigena]